MHHTTNDIYIHIYIYTHTYLYPKPCIPIGKRFCGIYMYSLWNTGTFIDPLHSKHSFLLVGNLDSLSLRPSHRRTATIRRRHLTFCFESSLSYRSQRMALPPHARLARTRLMVCHNNNNNNTTWSSIIYIYY